MFSVTLISLTIKVMGTEGDLADVAQTHYRESPPRIDPAGNFAFSYPGKSEQWRARWLRYKDTNRTNKHSDREFINILVHSFGKQSEDVVQSRSLPEDTQDNVLKAFSNYFGVRANSIAERVMFCQLVLDIDNTDWTYS